MKKIGLLLIGLLVLTQSLFASEKMVLEKHFVSKIDEVVQIVKTHTTDKEERNTQIVKAVTPMFDFTLMAKLSLGKKWKLLNKKDKKEFVRLYVERMKQSYSSKLDSYSDEKVEITSIKQTKKNRIELITNLLNNEKKLEIIYKFYKPKKQKQDKDKWLIYDVVILGVSILKTDKAQFREYLQTKTIKELLVELETK
ncbi:MAG: toluene tolerance protein [Arcobacter sp.]|nr:MAG: toluene tolerance protein [Arcobacter sp.]